jgi:hypothetical protein
MNQQIAVRPIPALFPNHNQTIVRNPFGWSNHNQTLVRR